MTGRIKKTVLRTVRLTQDLDVMLRDDAKAKGTTVNGLINNILTKYAEWDRHLEKFRFISIASEAFKSIISELDDDQIERIGSEVGSTMPKAVALFWFKKLNLEALLKTISNYGKYSGLQRNEIKVEGNEVIITFYHELGLKWSVFLKNLICQFVKSVLGVVPKTEITDDMLLVSFRALIKSKE
jgi:hypothetical protein